MTNETDDELLVTREIKPNPRWYDLNDTQRDLLLEIYQMDHPKGTEILDAFEHTIGQEASSSRLYPNLDQLVELDLIEKSNQFHDRRSHCYQITRSGIKLVESRAQVFASITSRGPGGQADERS